MKVDDQGRKLGFICFNCGVFGKIKDSVSGVALTGRKGKVLTLAYIFGPKQTVFIPYDAGGLASCIR